MRQPQGSPARANGTAPGTGSSTATAALGGGHDVLGHRLPAEAVRRGARQRSAGRGAHAADRARSHPLIACARSSTARMPRSNVSSSRTCERQPLAEDRRHLGEAGVAARDRQRAGGGGLGGDHSERLGEHARHHHRLRAGSRRASSPCSSRPVKTMLRRIFLRGREVALVAAAEALEEGAQVRELVARPALERAALPAHVHQQPLVGALEPAEQHLHALAVGAEPDHHQLRASAGAPAPAARPRAAGRCPSRRSACRRSRRPDRARDRSRRARRARRRRCPCGS